MSIELTKEEQAKLKREKELAEARRSWTRQLEQDFLKARSRKIKASRPGTKQKIRDRARRAAQSIAGTLASRSSRNV